MSSETLPEPSEGAIIDAEIVQQEMDWFKFLPFDTGVNAHYAKATTVDELLSDVPEAEGLREFTGKPLTIYGASLRQGELDGKQTWYVIVDAITNSTGERKALTTGAGAVMRQLARAFELDLYPFEAMPYEVTLGRKGRSNPLHLGAVGRF